MYQHIETKADEYTDAFRRLYEWWDSVKGEHYERGKAKEAEFRGRLEALYRKKYPKRKLLWEKIVAEFPDEWEAIKAEAKHLFGNMWASHSSEEKQVEWALGMLAEHAAPTITDEAHTFHAVDEGTYRSQGWGACKYARNSAQSCADEAEYHGLKAEVRDVFVEYDRPIHSPYNGTIRGYHNYEVWVNTDRLGWEIVTRKGGVPLRDWLMLCWRRGVNPRVYNPFLPHGIEEKLEIDHFGNDLREKRQATA